MSKGIYTRYEIGGFFGYESVEAFDKIISAVDKNAMTTVAELNLLRQLQKRAKEIIAHAKSQAELDLREANSLSEPANAFLSKTETGKAKE